MSESGALESVQRERKLSEQEVLKKLDIPDFRHMTKDKVITFASMMNKMDPDVAKKAIEQFPKFSEMASSIMADYKSALDEVLKQNAESSKQCVNAYQRIIETAEYCVKNDNPSFEEKKYFFEVMKEAAESIDKKDLQNKSFWLKVLPTAAVIGITLVAIAANALGGGGFALGPSSGNK